MKQKIIIKSVKIQSAFRKNGNSFACNFEQHPNSEADREKGSLFGVIEISGEPDLSKEIADIIFGSLSEAYFELAPDGDALKRFEYALGRINESLAEYSEGGKDGWVGNLSAVLAVVLGKELHITQSGEAGAYLLRKSFFTSISDGLANKDGHPIKTFTNIASGALEKFDKLVVYTPSLLKYVSKDHLKDELFGGSVDTAAGNLYQELQEKSIVSDRLALMILDITDTETLAERFSDLPDEYIIEDNYADNIADYLATASEISKRVIEFAKKYFGIIAKNLNKTGGILSIYFKAFRKKVAKASQNTKHGPKVNDYSGAVKMKSKNISFKRFMPSLKYMNLGGAKIMLSGFLVALVIFVSTSAFRGGGESKNQLKIEDAQSYLVEASGKQNEALYKIASGDLATGKKELEEADELIAKVSSSRFKEDFSEELSTLSIRRQQVIDQLENVSRIAPLKVADLPRSFDKLVFANGEFNVFSKNGWGTFKADAGDFNLKETLSSGVLSADTLNDGTVVYLTDEPMVYGSSGNIIKRQSLSSGSWYGARSLVAFSSNVYLLGEDGVLYRHTRVMDGFGKQAPYLKESFDFSKAVDMTIDDSIYVLMQNGSVNKFSLGAKQVFELAGNPQIKKPKYIYTSSSLSNIYIFDADSKHLLVFDKRGNFIRKLASDKFEKLTSLASDKSGNVYFLAGKEVYKLPR